MTDLEYTHDVMFTRFYPNTEAGKGAWRSMAQQDGVAAVLTMHAKSVISQLKKAGYTVSKAKKQTQTIDDILKELGV